MIEASHKTSPKDIFLQLAAIITLYASAAGVLALLFQFIDIQIPDPLSHGSLESARYVIRFAVSSLVIMFPMYVWVMKFLAGGYAAEPERKEIRIRKWLTYFTLFAAGLIIMGDLVALVNSFLNGELTTRFLLKVLSVFLVAGTVFWYYYWDIKDIQPASMPVFRWAVVLIVIVVIVSAFFFVGSPKTERLRQFDRQRVNDLQTLQWELISYWQSKGEIPDTLFVLNNDITGFRVPVDPETEQPYGYEKRGDLTFNLCADFSLVSRDESLEIQPVAKGLEDTWSHGQGRVCFERMIDPDFFKVRSDTEKLAPVPVR